MNGPNYYFKSSNEMAYPWLCCSFVQWSVHSRDVMLGRPWVDPAWVTPNTMKLVFKGFSKHEVLNSKDWLAGIQIMCLIWGISLSVPFRLVSVS